MLLLKHRSWAEPYRSKIILVHVPLRLIEYYWLMMSTSLRYIVQPLEIPSTAWHAWLHYLCLPLVLARTSLAFPVPLNIRRIISYIGIGLYMRHNLLRCPEEIAALPSQGQRYHSMVIALENMFYTWFPFPAFRGGSQESLLAGTLGETGACIVFKSWLQVSNHTTSPVTFFLFISSTPLFYGHLGLFQLACLFTLLHLFHSFLQITIGYLIPIAILCAEETLSRQIFKKRNNIGPTLVYPPLIFWLYCLLLVPLSATVLFHGTVFLVSLFA